MTPGHQLIIPRRCVALMDDLEPAEFAALWELVRECMTLARAEAPDGMNIGVNVGAAAGQTVHHAHVHIIPRRLGDVPDPRGGVRWVVPATADYWSARESGHG